MSDFALELIRKYNKTPSEIAFDNMKKFDKNFNSDNIFALAYMATNEAIPERDREIFKELVHLKIEENMKQLLVQWTDLSNNLPDKIDN